MFRTIIASFVLVVCVTAAHASLNLTSFETSDIGQWQQKAFVGKTDYEVLQLQGKPALKAVSHRSASGLVLKKRIDLLDTPYLSWSWLIAHSLPELNERTKAGDDYAARIYVVIDGGLKIWATKSLSYVWSSSQPENQVWDNAYAGSNVKMVSVRGKGSKVGHWYDEKRNVYQDLISYFGDRGSDRDNIKAYRYIDVVALMTDTDNSGTRAESYYGDIIFSAE